MAARSPPLSEPRNRKFLRVTAMPRNRRSARLLSGGEPAVTGVAGQRFPAAEGVLQRLAQRRLARCPAALGLHPGVQVVEQRLAARLTLSVSTGSRAAGDLRLDLVVRLDAYDRPVNAPQKWALKTDSPADMVLAGLYDAGVSCTTAALKPIGVLTCRRPISASFPTPSQSGKFCRHRMA